MKINEISTENTCKTESVNYECVNTISSENNSSDTKIKFKNDGYVSYHDKMFEKIAKKYAAVAKENRSVCHTDSEISAYIWDKYHNKNSPRYVKGLSDEERCACESNERNVTFGRPACNCLDPVVRGERIPESIEIARENQYNRNKINTQIADLFAENHISVPQDVTLRFTIEPKEYKLAEQKMKN